MQSQKSVQARNKKACRSQTNAGSQCTPCSAVTYVSTPVVLFGSAVTYASIHVPAVCGAAAARFWRQSSTICDV